jgi:hypothetical protein
MRKSYNMQLTLAGGNAPEELFIRPIRTAGTTLPLSQQCAMRDDVNVATDRIVAIAHQSQFLLNAPHDPMALLRQTATLQALLKLGHRESCGLWIYAPSQLSCGTAECRENDLMRLYPIFS